ncbi:peptide deformylase [Allocatelliglobosispora scoriae]|uniref:Peptide deformylase n=1 Tax=Allocatelliglobosispora scoriae TaxID=643052 RepID=A0A841C0F7_9ACTN|nr:peptide deformylase [Allocatelliglobosispora scoriae]MBB5872532.1 peptide deformylase [Allocatelliglobosispora scoriae]
MPAETGTARPITKYGTPVLHQPCAEVTTFDEELSTLIDDMFASMYEARGVGLAANQIGVGLRIFVYDCPDAQQVRQVGHVVNPVLHLPPPPRELIEDREGCLSVPGAQAELARTALAYVTGFDKTGEPIRVDGTGRMARCLQHECDHLDGKVYVDRLTTKQRKKALADADLG